MPKSASTPCPTALDDSFARLDRKVDAIGRELVLVGVGSVIVMLIALTSAVLRSV